MRERRTRLFPILDWLQDDFVKLIGIVTFLHLVGSGLNMACRMVVGRLLTSEQYGEMEAVLQIGMLIGVPAGVAATALTRYVALAVGRGEPEAAGALVWRAARRMSIYIGAALVIVLATAYPMKMFLHFGSVWPILSGAAYHIMAMILIVPQSALSGMQRIALVTSLGLVGGVVRIWLSWILIGMGFGASGALAAAASGHVISVILIAIVVWPLVRHHTRFPVNTGPVYVYMWPVLLTQIFCVAIGVADMFVIKRAFSPEQAGLYGRAAAVGRLGIFFMSSFAAVLFPKVAAAHAGKSDAVHMLRKTILLGGVAACAAATFCSLCPALVIRFLHGNAYPEIVPWVRGISWALIPGSLAGFPLQYLMGKGSFRFLLLLAPIALAYVLVMWFCRNSVPMVIGTVASGGVMMLAGTLASVYMLEKRGVPHGVRDGAQ